MKILKSIVLSLSAVCLTAMCFVLNVSADSQHGWADAFIDYIQTASFYASGAENLHHYLLIYLDDDDIPELLDDSGIQSQQYRVVSYDEENNTYRISKTALCAFHANERSGYVWDSHYSGIGSHTVLYDYVDGELYEIARQNNLGYEIDYFVGDEQTDESTFESFFEDNYGSLLGDGAGTTEDSCMGSNSVADILDILAILGPEDLPDVYNDETKENMLLSAWDWALQTYGDTNFSVLYNSLKIAEDSVNSDAQVLYKANGCEFAVSCRISNDGTSVAAPYRYYNRLGSSNNKYNASDYITTVNGYPQISFDSEDAREINSTISTNHDEWVNNVQGYYYYKVWTWNRYLFIITNRQKDGSNVYDMYILNLKSGSKVGNKKIRNLIEVENAQLKKWIECASLKAYMNGAPSGQEDYYMSVLTSSIHPLYSDYRLGIMEDGTVFIMERLLSAAGPETNGAIITLFGDTVLNDLSGDGYVAPDFEYSVESNDIPVQQAHYASSLSEIPDSKLNEMTNAVINGYTNYMSYWSANIYEIDLCRYDLLTGGSGNFNNRLYVLINAY